MRLVKIAAAGVSVKVGDFRGNADVLGRAIAAAQDDGAHLLVTPELAISGYSLGDRVWWPDIARRSWDTLVALAPRTEGISAWLGLPIHMRGHMYNGVALVHDTEILGIILKQYLPTYSVFYEGRTWTSWDGWFDEYHDVPVGDLVFELPYGNISAEICEDLWSAESPALSRAAAGAEIICNCSASPFTPLKNERRKELIRGAAGRMACVYVFANLLGLDDSRLVFDGGGLVASPEAVIAEGAILQPDAFSMTSVVTDLNQISRMRAENSTWKSVLPHDEDDEDDVIIVEVDGDYSPAPVAEYAGTMPASFFWPDDSSDTNRSASAQYLDELFDALVLGLRDYFEKVGVFQRYLVALSGGRDSALCLVLAAYAARLLKEGEGEPVADRVASVYLPNSNYSSQGTEDAARKLAEEFGVPFQVVTIDEEAEVAFRKAAELAGGEDKVAPMAKQNLQARIRGAMMLNWANSVEGLLLVTSNLSEAAVGYTTTGGDNQGGYSPVANIPKTLISRLLDHIAQRDGLASLQGVLDIPPSAELAADQTDEDDLMPYAVLDDLLFLFAGRRMALPNCWRVICERHPGHDPEQLREWTAHFGRLFAFNQWKREQLPVALRVLELDLDPKTGFRFPVTQSIENELAELKAATR